MTPDQQCKSEGFEGFWELIVLSDIPVSTLKNWNVKNPRKFKLAMDAAKWRDLEKNGITRDWSESK